MPSKRVCGASWRPSKDASHHTLAEYRTMLLAMPVAYLRYSAIELLIPGWYRMNKAKLINALTVGMDDADVVALQAEPEDPCGWSI